MAHVLVICTRRIGDVLLATPLVQSLLVARPGLQVDMLVFKGTEDVLSGWPALTHVWTIEEGASLGAQMRLLRSLWRRYDVAISTLAGDRPTVWAWACGRYRVGTLLADRQSRWKRALLHRWIPFDNVDTHTVTMNLRLLEPLGIPALPTPVVSWRPEHEAAVRAQYPAADGPSGYAVLHVSPKFRYKTWTVAGWVALGRWLVEQGVSVAVAAGESAVERALGEQVTRALPTGSSRLIERLSLPALGCLLSRASLYVGTDTAVSHMAAAVGTPTVVLFGPSNPVKWGPWPKDFPATAASPWTRRGSQRQGNVLLLQGEGDCVPCLGEGCDRHVDSLSDCLQTLSPDRVIRAAAMMLCERERTPGIMTRIAPVGKSERMK
jgi:heptosyltransferase-3